MSTAPLEQAIEATKAVLANVTPEQLAAATPCASWKVADIINHVVGGQYFFATAAKGEPAESTFDTDYAAGDFTAAFADGTSQCVAAFKADGAMEKIIHLPFGDMPGSAVVGLAATDTFVHGWDLARATGQSTDLNPELAEMLLDRSRQSISDAFRGPDGKAPFGPEQPAPEGASKADQLAAFMGRSV